MGSIAKRAEVEAAAPNKREVLQEAIEKWSPTFGRLLPKTMTADRFKGLLIAAASANKDLLACDPLSFVRAGLVCAQLGLEPNDPRGLAYMIPFKDGNRGMVVNLIIGYRGMVDLARRSGQVSSVQAFAVYQGDEFTYELGLEPRITHVPDPNGDEDPKKLTHVYAVAKVSGDPQFVVLNRKQIEKAKAVNKGSSSSYSPWSNWYVEMAQKTAIRRLCKMLPQTVEVAGVIAAEEQGRAVALGDLGIVSSHAEDDEVIDADSTEEPPAGVDAGTGEVIDVPSTPVDDEDDPERPF